MFQLLGSNIFPTIFFENILTMGSMFLRRRPLPAGRCIHPREGRALASALVGIQSTEGGNSDLADVTVEPRGLALHRILHSNSFFTSGDAGFSTV
ncbi:hypothetical protein AVEN_39999-1 [Araneus ventricosus]|uniref:Uncharacterized protein n=1 Tax=Araneus ventricosus TaxID=182803 RepID=A0A4Y2BC93_ARAVE|nr:hypothetical protein AVEN_39999-1 [Araneus ventricosus]